MMDEGFGGDIFPEVGQQLDDVDIIHSEVIFHLASVDELNGWVVGCEVEPGGVCKVKRT